MIQVVFITKLVLYCICSLLQSQRQLDSFSLCLRKLMKLTDCSIVEFPLFFFSPSAFHRYISATDKTRQLAVM